MELFRKKITNKLRVCILRVEDRKTFYIHIVCTKRENLRICIYILVLYLYTFLVGTTGVLISTCGGIQVVKSSLDMLITSGAKSVEKVSRDSSPS